MSNSTAHYCWVRIVKIHHVAPAPLQQPSPAKSERDQQLMRLSGMMQSIFSVVGVHPNHDPSLAVKSPSRPPWVAAIGQRDPLPPGLSLTPAPSSGGQAEGLVIDSEAAGQWWLDSMSTRFDGMRVELLPFYGTREQAIHFAQTEGHAWCTASGFCFLICFQQ